MLLNILLVKVRNIYPATKFCDSQGVDTEIELHLINFKKMHNRESTNLLAHSLEEDSVCDCLLKTDEGMLAVASFREFCNRSMPENIRYIYIHMFMEFFDHYHCILRILM